MEGLFSTSGGGQRADKIVLNRDETAVRRRGPVFAAAVAAVVTVFAIAGHIYWQSYRDTPQYSLALLISAARSNDESTVNSLVDVDSVVDDFIPQVTSKAVEMYGRGLTEKQVAGLSKVARPILPAVKNRVRARLPQEIREKTERFENVPFALMVLGADRYLAIASAGDSAKVSSKLAEHKFEVQMKREDGKWIITGIRDEQLSTDIARAIGEEIIAIGSGNARGDKIGVRDITELLQAAEEILQ